MSNLPSKTFCVLPFLHLATHPHGTVTPCCESDPTDGLNQAKTGDRILKLGQDPIENIMNSDYFNGVRTQMLAGCEPDACKVCYRKEEAGVSSKRERENKIFSDHISDCRNATNIDGSLKKVDLRFLELRLGNVCNVKCRSCNPASSSRWMDDHIALKNKLDFLKFDYEWIKPDEFKWPQSEDFWKELMDVTQNVESIYINGGEPTLIKRHWKFLQDLVDADRAKDIKIWYSVNMTRMPENEIQVWKEFKDVRISASIDDLSTRNFYIRWPTEWNRILSSIQTLKENGISWDIMQTISIMNIFYLPEFYKWANQFGVNHSYNYVNEPEHLNPRYIPESVKSRILDRLNGSIDPRKYIEIKNLLADNSDSEGKHWAEFCRFTREMDKLRGQSFKLIFPGFYQVLLECGVETP